MSKIIEDFVNLDKKTFKLMKRLKEYPRNNEHSRLQFRNYLTQLIDLMKRASEEKNPDAYFKIDKRIDTYETALRLYFRDVISLPFVPPPRVSV
jgi:hypothetical protein